MRVSASQTASGIIAETGSRFLLLDVEVVSHLGVPIRHVYYGDFELVFDGKRIDPALGPSQAVPDNCDGFDVPRWRSRRCTVVFEIPNGIGIARLHMDDFRYKSRSGDLDLRDLPQAEIPRVELHPEVQFAGPSTYREGMKRVDLLVEVQPLNGSAPLTLKNLILRDASGRIFFSSYTDPQLGGCSDLLVEHTRTCHAIYYVPMDVSEGTLTLSTYAYVEPGASPAAGLAQLQF